VVALFVIASASQAVAHTRSETQSVWRIAGSSVHVTYTIPEIELPRLAHPDRMPATPSEIADYVRRNVAVLDRDQPCMRSEDVRAVAASSGYRQIGRAHV